MYLKGLVPEKVNFWIFIKVPQTEGLIPTFWKHIKGNLPTYGKFQPVIREITLESFYESLSDIEVLEIIKILTFISVIFISSFINNSISFFDDFSFFFKFIKKVFYSISNNYDIYIRILNIRYF